jgi:hypothetical protein
MCGSYGIALCRGVDAKAIQNKQKHFIFHKSFLKSSLPFANNLEHYPVKQSFFAKRLMRQAFFS